MSEESQTAELLRQGIAAAKAGRKEEAHEALLQVVKLDERSEQAWLWLSAVVDSNEERQTCLENVVAINPANTRARAGLEWLRQSSPVPETPTAEEEPCPRCGEATSASSSACPSCGLPLSVPCPRCGEHASVEEPACPHCGQALGDFRQGPAYHLGLASLYLQNHSTERAQEALDRAEAEAAGDAEVLAQAGALYEEAGLHSRAIAAYERAIEAAPLNPAPYTRLGALYRQQGERAKATAAYQKAEELGSQDPAVTCELAQLEVEAGASQRAVARLQPLLRKQPVEPRAILLMGDALQNLGDREAAVAHYQRVTELAPADTEVGREARGKLAQIGTVPSELEQIGAVPSELEQAEAVPSKPAQIEATPAKLARSSSTKAATGKRPGCVTLYALLTIASALLGILGAIGLAVFYIGGRPLLDQAIGRQGMEGFVDLDQLAPALGVILGLFLLSALVSLLIGVGLWLLKNWARVAVIVISILGLLSGLGFLAAIWGAFREASVGAAFSSLPAPVIVGLLAGFLFQVLIIFWFLVHRDEFH